MLDVDVVINLLLRVPWYRRQNHKKYETTRFQLKKLYQAAIKAVEIFRPQQEPF